jgi:hypothetical protein
LVPPWFHHLTIQWNQSCHRVGVPPEITVWWDEGGTESSGKINDLVIWFHRSTGSTTFYLPTRAVSRMGFYAACYSYLKRPTSEPIVHKLAVYQAEQTQLLLVLGVNVDHKHAAIVHARPGHFLVILLEQ